MKLIYHGLAACVGLALLPCVAAPAMAQPVSNASFEQLHAELLNHGTSAKLMIGAHRGQWRDYPENSVAGIVEAITDGADIVEIDVMLTADGVPVLMHDATVDRTTNGTGRVSDLTLAEIKSLRLVEGLGGNAAAVTEHTVPTLEEAMLALKGKALVNLDKGWEIRTEMYQVLQDTDTVDHAIFKGSPDVQQAADFMATDEEILYMHIIDDATASHIGAFPERPPVAYEVIFDSLQDPQVQPDALTAIREDSRIWINTLWDSLAAGHTDENSLRGADENWDTLVEELGATALQTDNVEAMDYWRDGGRLDLWDREPGSIRVQAEDPIPGGQGVGYQDNDANRCGIRPDEPFLDVCDQRGARVLGWIRGGEWVKYSVDVKRSGTYDVSARVSSPYVPAGTIVTEWDGEASGPFSIGNTTSHDALERQDLESRHLEKGVHELTLRMPADQYQNFNIDYFQLDLVK
ncbi:glycerophosphodiester phosphodiesterase family protein [Arthrobacter sp. 4R501]|uniref:glycerophosphodiester phosphodiesterase family protein n=1 Tax=Arthrobacter sp. 4R501 TaxID=2058886 RepID=UPI000CE37F20|nr:glycerophosphodiester phosphodiesterase family protein [Arthrobacter sp. 4R501]